MVVFTIAILGGLIYVRTRPMPSVDQLNAADRRYRDVRALFPNPQTRNEPTSPTLVATTDTAALRARGDRLFRNIVEDRYGLGGFESVLVNGADREKILAHLDEARALAALYDKGIRVSPGIRFKPGQGRIFSSLAYCIATDSGRTGCDTTYEQFVEALKFLRVVGYQASSLPSFQLIDDPLLNRPRDTLAPLPAGLMNLDLNLLAPGGPMDWDRCVAFELDFCHELRLGAQDLLDSRTAFKYVKYGVSSNYVDSCYKPVITNALGLYGAVAGPPMHFAPNLEKHIQFEQSLEDYAAAWSRHEAPAEVPADIASAFRQNNEQIESRLRAGGIELRRGAPFPSPDTIGPGSYFFDPITQRPYKLYVSRENPNYAHLHVRRPVIATQHTETTVMEFYLSADHPGLENVPKLK